MRAGKIVWTVLMGALALGLVLLPGHAIVKQPLRLQNQRMMDYRMRCNEARCVRMGIDPYEVWKGHVQVAGFVPWDFDEAVDHHEVVPFRNYVHAYPPWAYSMIMPFTFWDDVSSACWWIGLLWGLAIAGTCVAFVVVYREFHCLWLGFLSVSVVWLFGSSFLACCFYGNYSIPIACAIAVAIALHRKGMDGWAGVLWSLALIKPQASLLFVIPLLCLRKWKTLRVMAVTIIILTLVPCLMCHRTPWAMLFAIADYSAGQFFETGFIAQSVFLRLIGEGGVPPALLTLGSAAAGALICVALTWILADSFRDHRFRAMCGQWDIAVVCLPALVLSTVWTAVRGFDYSIHAVTAVVLLCLSTRTQCPKWVRVCAAVMIPILVVTSFETEFGWPINAVRMASVVGLVVLTIGFMGNVGQSLPSLRQDGKCKAFFCGILSFVFLGLAAHGVLSVGDSMEMQPPLVRDQKMIDFHMRRNEACCVREGVDPFLVWRGDIRDVRYMPWNFTLAKREHALMPIRRFVHAYPPWEYAVMLPFSWMDERNADSCFIAMTYLALAFLSGFAVLFGHRLTGRWWGGCLLLAVVWRFAVPYACCIMYGNFGIIIAALMAASLFCQSRGYDVLAGVGWILCFVKPQIAVILLIPLLVLRKWRTLATVFGGLVVLTLIPSVLCRRSPWDMLVCIREYSVNQYNALALISEGVFRTLTQDGGIEASTLILYSSILLATVCLLLTSYLAMNAKYRLEKGTRANWVYSVAVFAPALLLSTVWTSARLHDLSVQSVTACVVLALAYAVHDRKVQVVSMLLVVALCCQYIDVFHPQSKMNVFHSASVALLCVWCAVMASCLRTERVSQ